MKKYMIVLICLFVAFGSFGCSKDPKKGGLITQKLQTPSYYGQIPADTPYFFSDMMPVPYKKLNYDVYKLYAPLLTSYREDMVRQQQNMPPDTINMEERVVLALLEELDGNFSPDGLQKLGINARGSFALYGVGMWPVLRIPVSDQAKFEAMLKRVETKVGKSVPTQSYKGVTFREIGDNKIAMPMVLSKNSFTIGLTSKTFRPTYLDYMLGKTLPKNSMLKTNKLLAIQKKHKYKPFMTGYVDLAGITAALVSQDKSNFLFKSIADVPDVQANLSADCKTEYLELVKAMPRVVVGYREVSANGLSMTAGMEVTNDVAKNIASTKSAVPLANTAMTKEAMGWVGVGLDVEKLIGVLKVYGDRIKSAPYKCAHLRELNNVPRMYNQVVSAPTQFKSIKGASFVIGNVDVDLQNNKVNALDVAFVLRTSDPQGIFQMGKLAINSPGFQNVNPKTDGTPVELPLPAQLSGILPSMPKAYVVMTSDALGLALGTQNAQRLSAALKQPLSKDGPMAIMSYDVQRFIKAVRQNLQTSTINESDRAVFDSLMTSYSSFGPSVMSFDSAPAGFFMTSKITFVKPAKK